MLSYKNSRSLRNTIKLLKYSMLLLHVVEMGSLYHNMQDGDTGIYTIFNTQIHYVSQYIAIIGYID